MTITKEKLAELTKAATPLIQWLNENAHPHCFAAVDQTSVVLHEEVAGSGTLDGSEFKRKPVSDPDELKRQFDEYERKCNALLDLPRDLRERIKYGHYGGKFREQYYIEGVDGTLAQLGQNLPHYLILRDMVSAADEAHAKMIQSLESARRRR